MLLLSRVRGLGVVVGFKGRRWWPVPERATIFNERQKKCLDLSMLCCELAWANRLLLDNFSWSLQDFTTSRTGQLSTVASSFHKEFASDCKCFTKKCDSSCWWGWIIKSDKNQTKKYCVQLYSYTELQIVLNAQCHEMISSPDFT